MPVRLNAPLMSFPAELLDEENPSQFHVFLKMFIVIYIIMKVAIMMLVILLYD